MGFGWRVCQCSECNGAMVTNCMAYRHAHPSLFRINRKRKLAACDSDDDEPGDGVNGEGDDVVDALDDADDDADVDNGADHGADHGADDGADDVAEDQINNNADDGSGDDPGDDGGGMVFYVL